MLTIHPVALESDGIRLEPLSYTHEEGLAVAVADGKLWELWFTVVPRPAEVHAYITEALAGQEAGHMLLGGPGIDEWDPHRQYPLSRHRRRD